VGWARKGGDKIEITQSRKYRIAYKKKEMKWGVVQEKKSPRKAEFERIEGEGKLGAAEKMLANEKRKKKKARGSRWRVKPVDYARDLKRRRGRGKPGVSRKRHFRQAGTITDLRPRNGASLSTKQQKGRKERGIQGNDIRGGGGGTETSPST